LDLRETKESKIKEKKVEFVKSDSDERFDFNESEYKGNI
jgi:hypothetical protein